MTWAQDYNPLGHPLLSTLVALAPVAVLFGAIVVLRLRIHIAALLGMATALLVAVAVFRMPAVSALAATAFGAAYGFLPIGWIILNLLFLYQLTVKKGHFDVLRGSLASLAPDPRVQVILIAFALGAFFEGAAGFGTPVAVTAVILIELGFTPLAASGLSLIANTAPVAYAGLGTPIIALSKVTGLDELTLSAMVGRQLPLFSMLIPFWLVWALAGFRGMWGVWPVALAAGLGFAVPQYLVSNFHGPWLVDIVASLVSIVAILAVLRIWQPAARWTLPGAVATKTGMQKFTSAQLRRAWFPWLLLTLLVFVWGIPAVKTSLDRWTAVDVAVPKLDQLVVRTPPVVAAPTPDKPTTPEPAVFRFNWLSTTGTSILITACLAGLAMKFSARELLRAYWQNLVQVRWALVTVSAMFALGFVTRYAGADATIGLALAGTGVLYSFFGTLLGWLGVALTGSDTASNVLFGSLQRITAQQLGLSPELMAAANTSGGMVGKMINAQSIVVASTATNWYGHEREILRYVVFHSLALAALVGGFVTLQAYVWPFTLLVTR